MFPSKIHAPDAGGGRALIESLIVALIEIAFIAGVMAIVLDSVRWAFGLPMPVVVPAFEFASAITFQRGLVTLARYAVESAQAQEPEMPRLTRRASITLTSRSHDAVTAPVVRLIAFAGALACASVYIDTHAVVFVLAAAVGPAPQVVDLVVSRPPVDESAPRRQRWMRGVVALITALSLLIAYAAFFMAAEPALGPWLRAAADVIELWLHGC